MEIEGRVPDQMGMDKASAYLETSLRMISDNLESLADGNTSNILQIPAGDDDTRNIREQFMGISKSLERVSDSIHNLVEDTSLLSASAIQGKLTIRGDGTRHRGEFLHIVENINTAFDSVVNPLHITADYLGRISKGDIPPPISDEYYGESNEVKTNLNLCIEAINSLVWDTVVCRE
ncbi:MAG: hypothetical protein LUQ50_09850 [Methanospirillum sp.]|uniref:hypothetical protein n=1 Tax=Methanospirillum sp. TaxID=45200 RepID=UPI00236F881F|nr:hypothetical protein [Methanospirillum sp.]MDD1729359.1 hypothetical protein [Methanospirillum sp.]